MVTGIFLVGGQVANAYPGPDGPPEGAPRSTKSLMNQLLDQHPGWLDSGGDFATWGIKNGRRYAWSVSKFGTLGIIYYGDATVVNKATYSDSAYPWKKSIDGKNHLRYFGISADGASTVPDFLYPDDLKTTGDLLGRDYLEFPWGEDRLKLKNVNKPGFGYFNDPGFVQDLFYFKGEDITENEARQEIYTWLDGVVDKYKSDHDFWRRFSSNFKRTDTRDQFKLMTPERKRQILYIATPPTTYTYGVAVEWHSCNSSSGYCYDTFFIDPLAKKASPDLMAVNLKPIRRNTYFYDVEFSAKNVGGFDVKTNVFTKFSYKIGNGSWQSFTGVYHGSDWSRNKLNTALIGNISIPFDTPPGTPIRIRAEINPVINGSRQVDEQGKYSNNTIERVIYTDENPTCMVGGVGSRGYYSYEVCSSWGYDEDYGYYCASTTCSGNWYYLNNTASVTFANERQTLLGIWSRNSGDHVTKQVPIAKGADIKNDKFSIELEGQFVDDLKKMGVDDPRRVMKAGRPVQMYGTIKVELNLMSFSGLSDIENKKNRFMSELLDSLETHGIAIDPKAGAVKNNKGHSVVKAQIDNSRSYTVLDGVRYDFRNNPEGYMYKGESGLTHEVYGDYSCTRLDVYSKSYKFVIPVKTFNEGGSQETSQKDYFDKKSYNVGDDKANFYTHINTPDGVHGLEFWVKMDPKILDSQIPTGPAVCRSTTEVFKIKGSIYDDVGSQDHKPKDGKYHDDDWDF